MTMFARAVSVVVVIALCVVDDVSGCSCSRPGPATDVMCRQDRFVVKGTVNDVKIDSDNVGYYYITVEEVFWLPAEGEDNSTITVIAFVPNGFSCSASFDKGQTYLLTGSYYNGRFVTSYCHRLAKWDDVPRNEIEALRNFPSCISLNLDEFQSN
ncbi:uncharacterized protein LOC121387894 [Gigantopelta aegis]|uniref:uncharacterized protein LOC121387894 n=1 Tax=Gigantopelta aegis TaxID=1735272 RepID=UPI001B88BDBE|nr:uncharacterized protein LOC121387894 [Gigantopelta aegis]